MKPKVADISNSRGVLLARGLKRWGPSDAEIADFKTRIDKHQHATQSVEVEETRLWELDYKPEDIG